MPPRRPRCALRFARTASLEAGSDAHYRDPGYYTATYADRVEDIDYYLKLAVRTGGRVLEYGCGNGRILLPLACCGLAITGVDRSAAMLADLRARLRRHPAHVADRVALARGDMRAVRLHERFDLVLCTFNTFLHLYTRRDVERFCQRVREHLRAAGRFVFDVAMPRPAELCRDRDRLHRTVPFVHAGLGEVVRYGERFDYHPLTQVLTVSMEFEPKRRPAARWAAPLAHRQFFPQELEALLHYNGLAVTEVHGDFERSAPDRSTDALVYHCRKR